MGLNHLRCCTLLAIAGVFLSATTYGRQGNKPVFLKESKSGDLTLTAEGATHLSTLAFECIQLEYPNKTGHVVTDDKELTSPSDLHPAFYGCFDWHSSVHGHWMLVRLLKKFPRMEGAEEIKRAISENITPETIKAEAKYFGRRYSRNFERTYGWAWLLKLAEELHTWDAPQAREWEGALNPLVDTIVAKYMDFLPRQTYPIRTGVHPNTAFGLSFALDYARTVGNEALENMIEKRSRDYFLSDTECPVGYEPGGEDFFSPCLNEAELMSKVLDEEAFREWLQAFLPGLPESSPMSLYSPAMVSDRSDMKIVHLDGLNLSRAWTMRAIASKLPEGSTEREVLTDAAREHIMETLPNVASGDYAGEHWLASFAVYALGE
ncbi:DUF2891 domain-containing protein [Roseivirga sp. BDSF3-8]|uniref:DUF2891 domain-containing protein n=1 Tax=Roseivirga sp. BDSF3-8 TaxID=3241598 RepID=UPI003531B625